MVHDFFLTQLAVMEGKWSQNLNIYALLIPLWTILKILFVATISILIVWYVKYLWGRRKLYLHSIKVPGPLSPPLIGSAMHFAGDPNGKLCFTSPFHKCFIHVNFQIL